MEDVVLSHIFPAALHGYHILGVGHHADGARIPLGAGADGAGAVPLGEVLADGTAVDVGLGVHNGPGEGGGLLFGQGQHIKGQPLGGLDAHARQLGEVLHQIFKGRGEILHGKDLRG